MSVLIDAHCDSLIDGQELYKPGDLVNINGRNYTVQRTITVGIMHELGLYTPGEPGFKRYLKSTDNSSMSQ